MMRSSPKLDQRVEAFFSTFDNAERIALEAFLRRVERASAKADIIVVMARRAWCLLSVFRLLGRFGSDKPIISDRTLDWAPHLIVGKSVLVVDDCIVTGSALGQVLRQLRKAKSVHIEVFAYNKEKLNTANVTPPPECLAFSSQQISEICSNIVDGFSLVPIPYATDFPLYTNLTLTQAGLFSITHATEFHVHDLRTPAQVEQLVFNYSLLPRIPVRRQFEEQIGLSLPPDTLIKVRLLGRHLKRPPEAIWAVAVPMVVLPAIAAEEIDRILQPRIQAYLTQEPTSQAASLPVLLTCKNPECYKAKFRLLSALLAAEIMRTFAAILEDNYSVNLRKAKLVGMEHLLDGRDSRLFSLTEGVGRALPTSRPLTALTILPATAGTPPTSLADTSSLFDMLMAPFVTLAKENEAVKKADLFTPTQRPEPGLQRTLSLQSLRDIVADLAAQGVDTLSATSVFIDDAVDRGFVVPETHWSEQPSAVSRGYRYGENLLFNREDQALLGCMLREFFKATPRTILQATDLHKILSLLLRFGFNYHLFRPCTPELANKEREWISRKFWLHGVVPTVTTNRGVAIAKTDLTLLDKLRSMQYLSQQDTNGGYGLGNARIDFRQFDAERVDKSIMVGFLVGKVYRRFKRKTTRPAMVLPTKPKAPTPANLKKTSRPAKTENDLILLATCVDANDTVAALAAEAEYIVQKWGQTGSSLPSPNDLLPIPELLRYLSGGLSPADESAFLFAKRRAVFNTVNQLKTPLHSALWKYRSFVNGRCEKIALECEHALDTLGKATWRQLIGNYRAYREDWKEQFLGDHLRRSTAFFAKAAFLWAQIELLMQVRLGILTPTAITHACQHNQSNPDQLWLAFDQTQTVVDEIQTDADMGASAQKICDWMGLFAQMFQDCADVNRFELQERLRHLPTAFTGGSLVLIGLLREFEALLEKDAWDIVWIANELYRDVDDPSRVVRRQEFLVVDLVHAESAAPESHSFLLNNYVNPYNLAFPTAKLMPLPRDRWANPNQAVLIPIDGNGEVALLNFIEYVLLALHRWPCPLSFILLTNLPVGFSAYYSSSSSRAACGAISPAILAASLKVGHLPAGQVHVLSAQAASAVSLHIISALKRLGLAADVTSAFATALDSATQIDWTSQVFSLPAELPPVLRNRPKPVRQLTMPTSTPPAEPISVGIITVVSTETAAVHALLDNGNPLRELKEGQFWGGPFYFGEVSLADGTKIQVVHHQCTGEGQQPAADAFNRLVEEFHPEYLLLVGIAGGTHPKVKVGDVIFGQSVIYLEPGVYKNGAHHARIDNVPKVPECVLRLLQAFELRHGEEPTLTYGDRTPQVFRGTIGATESVVKDEHAEPRVLLKLMCENARAIEMEGAGFTRAFQTQSSRTTGAPRGWLVIRGISDDANRQKNDGARKLAAFNAASVMMTFLSGLTAVDFARKAKALSA